jgi:hypothetical protein
MIEGLALGKSLGSGSVFGSFKDFGLFDVFGYLVAHWDNLVINLYNEKQLIDSN